MSNHTKESLEALRLKGDVIEIAEGLGLDIEGTRHEIEERILAAQAAKPDDATDESSGESSSDATDDSGSDESSGESSSDEPDDADDRARDDSGRFMGDDPSTAPDEAWSPPKLAALSASAETTAVRIAASYLGAAAVEDLKDELMEALAAGKQPCVVNGTGNARYEFKVFDSILQRHDVSKDVPGVVLNIARFLADKNLYPTGA